ncbi:DUF2889 domain-containing protein [Kiloniella laminariae]|uniref:DUF2889 domain-containing protein n=1 Tax=Kiloniella laminariae TaxID=454162 RepID=A0ABT4LM54_9PROT|nr:DUF2889 domain-containing protein [Kiloniella laminariae]MCZ4282184.1 DUF2889 domain-containing protein [Kiloniella laminariae]
MPLSPPVARKQQHQRLYDFQGYERDDGLWDIEGRITDVKPYAFPNKFRVEIQAGEALHDMSIRLTVGLDFVVKDIEAIIDESPYAICPAITPNFRKIIGLSVGPGWRAAIRRAVGGTEGCTHLVEMLGAMATVTFQTLYPALLKQKEAQENAAPREKPSSPGEKKRPGIIDSCHAYSAEGDVVREEWPDFYVGKNPV